MPKKKKDLEFAEPIAEFAEAVPQELPQPVPVPVARTKKSATKRTKVKPTKRMNFSRYARSKGFRTTHIPGMRAFAGNPNMLRTMEEWDAFFKDY